MNARSRSTRSARGARDEAPLSAEELRAYELHLRELLESLASEVGDVEEEFLRPSGGARFQPDDEPVEQAALDVELEALRAEDRVGYEIREALDRLREGTFGACVTCGARIARERLGAVPHASECIACARQHD